MKNYFLKLFMFVVILLSALYILMTPSMAFSPASDTIYEGIDVSAWQGYIDFNQVRDSGISIVYIKSSEGFSFVDPYFEQNYTNAKNAGLKVGFYHYVTARTISEATRQAEFFVSTISGKSPDCKLAIDFESFGSLDVTAINQISLAFIRRVEELSGKEVIVYSNEYNASNVFYDLSSYPLWVAQYEVSAPTVSANWNTWVGWQYTDQGEIPGISVYVDRDKFTEYVLLAETSELPTPSDASGSNPEQYQTIIIPYGTTLSNLASEYNTTVSKLVELNNIANPNLIYAGNTLIVPNSTTNNSSNTTVYVVKSGDTLSKIALDFGTTVTAIADANNISNVNLIYTGQTLNIPTSNYDMSHTLYVVKRGDTLWGISRRFGVSIAKIVMLNRISNPNLIYPGNILRI